MYIYLFMNKQLMGREEGELGGVTTYIHLSFPPLSLSFPLSDIEVLHEREDWQVHAEESGAITSLPILFENLVVEVLLSLKEVVIETHHGETAVGARVGKLALCIVLCCVLCCVLFVHCDVCCFVFCVVCCVVVCCVLCCFVCCLCVVCCVVLNVSNLCTCTCDIAQLVSNEVCTTSTLLTLQESADPLMNCSVEHLHALMEVCRQHTHVLRTHMYMYMCVYIPPYHIGN